jgi:hypothetical protein
MNRLVVDLLAVVQVSAWMSLAMSQQIPREWCGPHVPL